MTASGQGMVASRQGMALSRQGMKRSRPRGTASRPGRRGCGRARAFSETAISPKNPTAIMCRCGRGG